MASIELETCANCNRAIGKLETPMLWQDKVVCADCHAKLSKSESYRQSINTPNESSPASADLLLSSREVQAEEAHKTSSTNSHSFGSQKLGLARKKATKPMYWWVAQAVLFAFLIVGITLIVIFPEGPFNNISQVALCLFVYIELIVLFFHIYFLPTRIAEERNHSKAEAINMCNRLSILFIPLWFVALIWAHTESND